MTMRVVMYSPDSIGLGHMRRNATIAAELVRLDPTASVALLIGSGAGAYFSVPKGIDTIKLPSVQKVGVETWEARSLNLSQNETRVLRAGIIRDVVANLKPDVLLVDHLPMGVSGDLVPALDLIRSRGLATRNVLGLRDILDEPEIICRRWTSQGLYAFVAKHFQQILIYGDRDVFSSGEAYGLEDVDGVEVDHVGYVCSAADAGRQSCGAPRAVRELDGLAAWSEGEPIIVAAGGGGYDAYPMLSATVGALAQLEGTGHAFRAVVIAGPLMPDEHRLRLIEEARGLARTRLLPWTSDCMDYLAAADLSVVMGGYNSALEALSTSSRVIMIPRPGPSAEQRVRATMLAKRGLVTCIEQQEATPGRVQDAIVDALDGHRRALAPLLLDGATRAARRLIEIASRQTRVPSIRDMTQEASRYVVF